MSGRSARGATSVGTLVAVALLPKCPLCVAATLSALGVGAAAAGTLAPFVRPLGFALIVAAWAAVAWSERRRWLARRERSRGGCCAMKP
jgi:hypothetical protein